MRLLAICSSIVAPLALAPAAGAAGMLNISGGGDGHGIGMSQYGAYGYALHGKDYRFILAHYYQGTSLQATNPKQTVRVLIGTGAAAFSGATLAAGHKLKAALTYSLRPLADGTLALYNQSGKKVGRFAAPLRVTGPGPLSLAGHGLYRGVFEFRAAGNAVQAVDAVGLDDYVRGVVSTEMSSGWSLEALKAQAVAARTYAITANVGGNGYQLYPDTRSQVYAGVAAETPSTDAAVAATRGQIVTYHGVPAITFFFSSSGGYTEDIENVWLGSSAQPWLRGVPDPYDGAGSDPHHRWSNKLTIAAATAKLGSLVKGQLVGIEVTKRGVSPRTVTAQVVGTRGSTNVTGPQLQNVFGLLSTYMAFTTISSSPDVAPTTTRLALPRVRLAAAEAAFAVLVPIPRGLHGRIFPARTGTLAAVQVSTKRGWRTVRRVRLRAGGTYALRVSKAGTYRVVYHHVAGPAATVR
jgi:stage II sporulation protein D